MVRGKELVRQRLILPHFNSLWIVRESVKVLIESHLWLDDDSLVELLNKRGIIRGTDPRRARNIYEAALYLGLVKRRSVGSRKFEYTASSNGNILAKFDGDFPSSKHERTLFSEALRHFKVPNAAQYQEPSRFKAFYLHKRVRPFFLLLKALALSSKNNVKADLISASAVIYANNEAPRTISSLVRQMHSKFKKPVTSRAPFRDAHTLVSWGRQIGLLQGEGVYELTDQGSEFLKILETEAPIWWVDSTIEEFIALTILQMTMERGAKSLSLPQLVLEVERIIKELRIFKSKTGSVLPSSAHLKILEDEVSLRKPVSINIGSDVPFEHQDRMTKLVIEAATRLCQPLEAVETLKRRVKDLEAEITKYQEQLAQRTHISLPKIEELPSLATLDELVLKKYGGQTTAAAEFEKRVWHVFQMLNYDVVELGHRTKEIAPDAILINKYPSLLRAGPNEAIFVECKSSRQPYQFPRHDVRELQDYTERWYGACLKEYMAVPTAVVVVGGHFTPKVMKRALELESRLYKMAIIFVHADMLVSLVEEFLRNPGVFSNQVKATFFIRLASDAHKKNMPLKIFPLRFKRKQTIVGD